MMYCLIYHLHLQFLHLYPHYEHYEHYEFYLVFLFVVLDYLIFEDPYKDFDHMYYQMQMKQNLLHNYLFHQFLKILSL